MNKENVNENTIKKNNAKKKSYGINIDNSGVISSINPKAASEAKNNFAAPQFNSLNRQTKELEVVQSTQFKVNFKDEHMNPSSKAALGLKLTRKLNFGMNQIIYKNLQPINVNDSILLPQKPQPLKKKYRPSGQQIKSPELSDFLGPIPPLTHYVKLTPFKLELTDSNVNPMACYMNLYN